MEKPLKFLLLILLCIGLFSCSSCVSSKKIAYFSNGQDTAALEQERIVNHYEPTIAPDDILYITVSSPYSGLTGTEINNNELFSMPGNSTSGSSTSQQNLLLKGYRVDSAGMINFPLLGRINLKGLTTEKARDTLTELISKYLKDPVVNVRYLNYKVTVLGEVAKPGTYTFDYEKVTLLDALGMAGDITIYGKRNNILIIREQNGQRTFARVNISDNDIFKSPYFYLHQGDVVYVEPSKAKTISSDASIRYISIFSAVVTTLSAIILLYTRVK